MKKLPLILRLPRHLLRQFDLAKLVAHDPRWEWAKGRLVLAHFDLTRPERRFVLDVLRFKSNLWIWRCNQAEACGDFALVDMSRSDPARRRIVFVELKAAQDLRPASETHPQFARCAAAAAQLVREEAALGEGLAVERWLGEHGPLLTLFGRPLEEQALATTVRPHTAPRPKRPPPPSAASRR